MSESPGGDLRDSGPPPLEARYRRLLRLLPRAYRARWEEEMVATFRDTMRGETAEEAAYLADFGRPGGSEVASVVGLAVRLRLGGVEAPPRSFAWGEAVRRVALVGLLVHAVGATVAAAQDLWLGGLVPWPPVPDHISAIAGPWTPSLADLALGGAWVAAYFALLIGHRRVAKLLAATAFAPAAIATVRETASLAVGRPASTSWLITGWAETLLAALLLIALAAFHRDAPAVKARLWTVSYLAGLAVLTPLSVVTLSDPAFAARFLDRPGVWSVALVVAASVHVAGRRTRIPGPAPVWPLTLALLAAGVLGLRAVSIAAYALNDGMVAGPVPVAVGIVEASAVVAVGVPLAVLARQALRRLSPAGA